MYQVAVNASVKAIVLDIEGTICSISFVKEVLFPYFISRLPKVLGRYPYPLTVENIPNDLTENEELMYHILLKFQPEYRSSYEALDKYIRNLVSMDVKQPVLKELQGFVWQVGYHNKDLKAPLYPDAIENIVKWSKEGKKLYIYSSGSVRAQKLLLGHVDAANNPDADSGILNLNKYISDYFDTINVGSKVESKSYSKIIDIIGHSPEEILFLTDNVNEAKNALHVGINSIIVVRDGNAELSKDDKENYKLIYSFNNLV
ncbi:hypothetical protein PACTADRAFT_49508 [Pachysolen tannophilus NRRL Y-2460]|uniref:Enolase-phosphatase E1 n=1 Tax=Pachysolen tannophilus NRRL Y-2460 TaxID=669874 RepID=A0A1E4TWH2_PACTA|nr:hypothetical protein PACTADRAFT_49508 [Pachysolen tannophilus NRRL Y-2460]